jgi:ATP-dependent helicase/nuclease subunit A
MLKEFYQTEIIAHPVGWTALAEKERKFMRAETDRLLYVATTRARQLLVVSQYLARPEIDPWSGLGGYPVQKVGSSRGSL